MTKKKASPFKRSRTKAESLEDASRNKRSMKTSQSFIVHVVNVKKATSEKDRKTDESKIS